MNADLAEKSSVLDWKGGRPPRKCIDFIFSDLEKVSAEMDGTTYSVDDTQEMTPSDHLPVICTLKL
jgi:endonuclease/exonuclease/phosphatase family metal-dependent hydrolase